MKMDMRLRETITPALARLARATGKPMRDVLRETGARVAKAVIKATQPFGLTRQAKVQGQEAVERDIYRIYRPAWQAYDILKRRDRRLAAAFWAALNAGEVERVRAILRSSQTELATVDFEGGFDGGASHQRSRGPRGRARGGARAVLGLAGSAGMRGLKRYLRQVRKRVGWVKGGWWPSARRLKAKGIPAWVRNSGAPGALIAKDHPNRAKQRLILRNRVSYSGSEHVLRSSALNRTVQIELGKMVKGAERAQRKAAKRSGFRTR